MGFSLRNNIMAAKRLAGAIRHNTAGNVLAIVAAAIIPLAALVGSGIDMSRAYMAQSRLQVACDAGALAGRRAMSGGLVDATVRTEALKFFRFNFPTGEAGSPAPPYGVASFTPQVADGDDATVRMTAATTVPTTLMSMFGYTNIPISVTCFARQDFVNTDIVLVLDTTGSMADDVNNNTPATPADSKIAGLRTAVLALYDELKPVQDQLEAAGLRLRYSVVPYSTSVNVGAAIRSVDPNYLVSSWNYQSRKALFDKPVYTPHPGTPTVTVEPYPSGLSKSDCQKYGDNQPFTGFNPSPSGDYDDGNVAPNTVTSTTFDRYTWNGSTSFSGSGTHACERKKNVVVTTYTFDGQYAFTSWIYQQAGYDVSNFKLNSSITIATNTAGTMPASNPDKQYTVQEMAQQGTGFTTKASSWEGCIEERDTVPTINGTTTAVPSGAHDLNIDLIPNSDQTRWRPIWDAIEYRRNSTSSADPTVDATSGTLQDGPCPAAVQRLQAWSRADLNTYLNSLNPNGNTYHDIGMIWGARMLSNAGIFAGDNPDSYNSMPVARFLIFMTDGLLAPTASVYSAYGIEYLDQRVTGSKSAAGQTTNTSKRFDLACQAAKAKGVSIWVISFASSLSTSLTNCASKPSQASISSNSAALTAKFVEIGKNIGSLRLTQ